MRASEPTCSCSGMMAMAAVCKRSWKWPGPTAAQCRDTKGWKGRCKSRPTSPLPSTNGGCKFWLIHTTHPYFLSRHPSSTSSSSVNTINNSYPCSTCPSTSCQNQLFCLHFTPSLKTRTVGLVDLFHILCLRNLHLTQTQGTVM